MKGTFKRNITPFVCCIILLFAPASLANPVLKFIGEQLLSFIISKSIDKALGADDLATIKQEMKAFQSALEQEAKHSERTDAQLSSFYNDLSAKISTLSSELNEKTSRAHLEGVVKRILGDMESRLTRLEVRADELERLFGFLPTVVPAPLLADQVAEGNPTVHPLMADYAKLLLQCESSRLEITRLRQLYTDSAPELVAALAKDKEILEAAKELHAQAKTEGARLLPKRQELLKTRKPSHPDVRKVDSELASITWLCGISRPQEDGRLGVPRDLLGPKCSDIILAFHLSGVTTKQLTPLFRHLLNAEIDAPANSTTPIVTLPSALEKHSATWKILGRKFSTLLSKAKQTNNSLTETLRSLAEAHPAVINLRKQKLALLVELDELGKEAEVFLNASLSDFIAALREYRLTAPSMVRFRTESLQPAAQLVDLVGGTDATDEKKEQTWDRIQNFEMHRGVEFENHLGMRFKRVPGIDGLVCIHEVRSCDFAAFIADTKRGYEMEGQEKDLWKTAVINGVAVGRGDEPAEQSTHPVVGVNYFDAMAFCRWLSKVRPEKRSYRMLTDREYSILFDQSQEPLGSPMQLDMKIPNVWPWGTSFDPESISGNYSDTTAKARLDFTILAGTYKDNFATTSPVMSFKPNKFGLYDLGGNVWEWTASSYGEEDLIGDKPNQVIVRTLRGGAWCEGDRDAVLASNRNDREPSTRRIGIGFRIAVNDGSSQQPALNNKETKTQGNDEQIITPSKRNQFNNKEDSGTGRGVILSINNDLGLVVVNIGLRDGVTYRSRILVTRGEEVVGRLKISKISDESTVTEIEKNYTKRKNPIKQGDEVVFSSL